MAIDAVSSNTPSVSSQLLQQARQQAQAQPTLSAKAEDEESKIRKAQELALPIEQPRPVVNIQGQTTGRVINTTA